MNKEKNCKDLVKAQATSRLNDLRAILDHENSGKDDAHPGLGRLGEYGLSFDYVAPGTFDGQRRGYIRYQISYGGPSEEIRYFLDERQKPIRVEFWHLDWFDGAKVTLKGDQLDTALEVFEQHDYGRVAEMIAEADEA